MIPLRGLASWSGSTRHECTWLIKMIFQTIYYGFKVICYYLASLRNSSISPPAIHLFDFINRIEHK